MPSSRGADLIVHIITDASRASTGVNKAISGYERFADTINNLAAPAFRGLVVSVAIGMATFKAASTQSEELSKAWTDMNKAAQGLIVAIGEALVPVMLPLIELFTKLANWASENAELFALIVTVVGAVSAAILVLNVVLKTVSVVTKAATLAVKLFNLALAANPIGLVIAAIAALVAAFIWLWNNVDGFKQFWIDTWENIKQVAEAVANWFKSVWDGAFKAVEAVLTWLHDRFVAVLNAILHPIDALIARFNRVVDAIRSVIDWIGRIQMPDLSGLSAFGAQSVTVAAASAVPHNTARTAAGVAAAERRALRNAPAQVNITVNGALDPDAVARQISGILRRRESRLGIKPTAGVR